MTSVTYRERIMLPRKSIVTATLEDVPRMDTAAIEIGKATILAEGAPPYHLTVPYDASRLSDTARYAVRARIEENGRLLFINAHISTPLQDRLVRQWR